MKQISLSITTYNRFESTIKSFEKVIDDPRINDIVIVDDASHRNVGQQLADYFKGNEKIRVIIQAVNVGMMYNKFSAIGYSLNSHSLIFDSDNILNVDFLDAYFERGVHDNNNVINVPSFARETFNYSHLSGLTITKDNVKDYMSDPMFRCLLNTCNYIVPVSEYVKTFKHDPSIKAADTIAVNYEWLKAGKSFYVVPQMEYIHTTHDSGFMKDVNENMAKAKEFEQKILEL